MGTLKKKFNTKKKVASKKLLAVFGLLMMVFLLLIGRLCYIMINKSSEYKQDELKQLTGEITVSAKRGSILDCNYNKLAVSLEEYRVDADINTLRQSIKGKMSISDLSNKLAAILNISNTKISKILYPNSTNPVKFATIARQIDKTQADKVKALNILGLVVSSDSKRYYENGAFLAGVLGHTDSSDNGVLGVESSYNKQLSGIPGKIFFQKDAKNNQMPYDSSENIPPADGKDVVLTIDEQIQHFAEDAAEKALTDNKAKSVTITVMNPNNGEILAMVNKPDYDPNNPNGTGNETSDQIVNSWKNNATQNAFEPGSIFKVITSYAALSEHVVNDDTRFYDPGYVVIDGVRINEWNLVGFPSQTFQDIIKNSSNVGFVNLGVNLLGKEKLFKYISLFNFGEKTGIDLPGESAGILRSINNTNKVDLANISFGQGIALTSVQYLAAFNSVANGGTWIRPHVMKEVVHTDANNKQIVDETYSNLGEKKIVDPTVASSLRNYLLHVVSDPTGVGHNAFIEGYDIAGKTGTAQKADPKTGGYAPNKYMASFAGMAPANNPKITLLVSIDEPDPSKYYAGQVAAPVAKVLYGEIFNYLAMKGEYDISTNK